MSGWFPVSRAVFDDPMWKKEPMSEREAYLWLCRNAAWEDTVHRVGNEILDCPKGSLFITLRDFLDTTSWGSDTKIRGFLQHLEDCGLIKRSVHGKRNARKTHVTICEYSDIQDSGAQGNASKTHRERTKNAVNREVENRETSEAKASSSDVSSPPPANDQSKAVARYNDAAQAAGWPRVQKLTPNRSRQLKARLAECGGPEGWEVALRKAFDSDFCRARTPTPWHGFGFDWLIKSQNFTKLLEGNYDNRMPPNPGPGNGPSDRHGNRSDPALEQIARIAGLGETPGDGGGGTRGYGQEIRPVRLGEGPRLYGS